MRRILSAQLPIATAWPTTWRRLMRWAGIGAALFRRATTGKGDYLDVALMDTVHNAMGYEYVDAQFPGQTTPTFRPMRTLDGFISMAPVSEGNFKALTRAANSPEWLEDPRFVNRDQRIINWQAFLDVIESWTQTITSEQAESSLAREGCPASIYRSIAESQVDPQVQARGSAVKHRGCQWHISGGELSHSV